MLPRPIGTRLFSAQSGVDLIKRAKDILPKQEQDILQQPINISYPSYIVWGSNTDVGKTLVSTGISSAFLNSHNSHLLYIKPVQTGFPKDSDARFVSDRVNRLASNDSRLLVSNKTMRVSKEVNRRLGGRDTTNIPEYAFSVEQNIHSDLWESSIEQKKSDSLPSTLTCKTLWSWSSPISPHLAVQQEGGDVTDAMLLDTLGGSLWGFNKNCTESDSISNIGKSFAVIETAGGVASPAPSGTLQCNVYRPLRLPGILVGDGKLGGISTTLAAYESLLLRGYETICILLQDFGLENHEHLAKYLHNEVPVFVLPRVPDDTQDDLVNWFRNSSGVFIEVLHLLEEVYQRRIQRLNEMPKKATELLWWPFTQHNLVPQEKVTVIDSRCGELFSIYEKRKGCITQQFDACASWWTQGPDASMQHELAKQISYAAGRYGHVMFPENVHEPGLRCAELLLQGVGQGWAQRVYFSDNGSTAIEIALKMAFRRYALDHGFLTTQKEAPQFKVLALRGSYHGDTLGAMEAQASSPYTGFLQQPWYSGRGHFMEPPLVFFKDNKWHLTFPEYYKLSSSDFVWDKREDVYNFQRDYTELARIYSELIEEELSNFRSGDIRVAGLIIEPVIHAAGGMQLVDPLFQRILVQICKHHKIPVIFDEVFTGVWRLGYESAWQILGCKPDIACYAKLLTGGTVPLAVTLASEEIFQAFQGPSKLDALLHGHSYTAHAVGCSAAVTALQWFKDPAKNTNLSPGATMLQEQWDPELVSEISNLPSVERVISMGTVFASELSTKDKGYNSSQSQSLVSQLRKVEDIYVRPLGNVVYMMCGPLTRPSTCSSLLGKLLQSLRNLQEYSI